MKINCYLVDASLPLPPSFSGISKKEQRETAALRKRITEALGVKILLTGRSMVNPNYKFDIEFEDKAAAQELADRANRFTGNPNFSEVIDASYDL